MCSALYEFFRDQGSIIAGLLALAAGIIAYRGARQAAEMQVRAVNKQTEALIHQNTFLKIENVRKLARESLISVRLIEGILSEIKDDIDRLSKLLDQPQYLDQPNAVAPSEWRALIHKPPLAVVWNNIGLCGIEVINKYLLLDRTLDEFANRNVNGVDYIKNSLATITNIVDFLRAELDQTGKCCSAVLADTPPP